MMKSTGKHIFISYRRTHWETARSVQTELKKRGYSVFLDVDDLNATGPFPKHLRENIRNASDVVVVIAKGALDRCLVDPKFNDPDWLREEIKTAIEEDINLIPLYTEDFEFPPENERPDDIRRLLDFQGVTLTHVAWQESFNRLEPMLKAKPCGKKGKLLIGIAVIAAIAAVGLFGISQFINPVAAKKTAPPQKVAKEKLKLEWNLLAQRQLPDGSVKAFPITNNATLYTGDQFRIFAKVNMPCYLYIVNVDAAGQIIGLYPDIKQGQRSKTPANINIILPDNQKKWFQLDNHVGLETVYIIVSEKPHLDLEHLRVASSSQKSKVQKLLKEEIRGIFQTDEYSLKNPRTVDTRLSSGKTQAVPLHKILAEDGQCITKLQFSHKSKQ